MTIIEWTLSGLLCGGSIVGMLWLAWTILTKKERKFIKLMKVYVGLPISGRSYDDVVLEIKTKRNFLNDLGYTVLTPMDGKSYLRNELKFKSYDYRYPTSTNHAIFERDCWMVAEQADIVFMDFTNSGDTACIGGIMELAIASYARKHTVCVIPIGNIHNHAFVLEASDVVFESTDYAIEYFIKLAQQDV